MGERPRENRGKYGKRKEERRLRGKRGERGKRSTNTILSFQHFLILQYGGAELTRPDLNCGEYCGGSDLKYIKMA